MSRLTDNEHLTMLKSIGEQNKKKILECIVQSQPNGRSTSELVNKTGLHRDTIYTLSTQLEKEGWIKKTGKYGKYHLTEKVLVDPGVSSWIFGWEAIAGIGKWSIPKSRPNKFCTVDAKNSDKDFQTESELFEFANKIGALITYILIIALRPRDIAIKEIINNNSTSLMVESAKATERIKISDEEKTEQARKWVENTISPFWILNEFCNLRSISEGLVLQGQNGFQAAMVDEMKTSVDKSISQEDTRRGFQAAMVDEMKTSVDKSISQEDRRRGFETMVQNRRRKMESHDPSWISYELDENTFRRLTTAFANIYPEINAVLEYVRKSLPDKIREHKEWGGGYLGEEQKQSY